MNLCLDTNVLIDLMRRRKPHYRDRLSEAAAAGATFHLSAVVMHELVFGARRSARPEHHLREIARLTAAMQPEAWTLDDAIEAARVRDELAMAGAGIGGFDSLLAGQARNRGWAVVTANLWEFGRVDGLQVIDWSDPAGPIDRSREMQRLKTRRP